MIRRLIILLLIVGCEETTAPTPTHGCLDSQATNYDATASIDNNSCTYIDSCGVIDIDLTNDCEQDCAGEWGGDAVLSGCDTICNSTAVIDDCGVCDGNGECDNNNTEQEFSIYHEISYGEQTLNNIIVKTDTITAFVSYEGIPSIEKYVEFNLLNNAQGNLTPTSTLSDSMGMAKSIYNLVYLNQISSDTIINVKIDIGVGNDENSISVHDTVNLTCELKAIDPLSAIEYFNFYPNNYSIFIFGSEELEISVIARDYAGVGVCNIPVSFELIGDEDSIPNGVINSEIGYTCESNSTEDGSENTFGVASITYTSDVSGIDTLIAKILDPSNETLYLFADTVRIETF